VPAADRVVIDVRATAAIAPRTGDEIWGLTGPFYETDPGDGVLCGSSGTQHTERT
jgi:hypothetical protein